MNVIEIDAASNNGVDNIREIREEVAYSPTEGKYKVYIIDEVHMLSIGAFNALLKTLEEPPSYVIFILATTEAHKIPITILSRCQRYDFRRIAIETIIGRLKELVEQEQVQVENKGLCYIAKAADGSMRDALSLLDQCIAFYLGENLTYDHVLDVLGAVDTEVFSGMLRKMIENDISGLIVQLEELIIQGREPGQFVLDFTWYLRNLLLLQSSAQMEDVLDISSENLVLLREESEMLETTQLMRYIRVFSELSNQIRYATQKRVLIEIALIKLCKPEMEHNYDSLALRITQLEKKMEQGEFLSAFSGDLQGMVPEELSAVSADGKKHHLDADATGSKENIASSQLSKAVPGDLQQVVKNWRMIVEDLSMGLKNYLRLARPSMAEGGQLLIVLEDEVAEAFVNTEEHREELRTAMNRRTGKEIPFRIELNQGDGSFEESYVDLGKLINMEITIEDQEDF